MCSRHDARPDLFVCLSVGRLFLSEGLPIPGGNGPGSLYDVELYDIDYSSSSALIADLQSKGKKVICHISAGKSEAFREDGPLFPKAVKGGAVSFGVGDKVSFRLTSGGAE